VAEDVPAVEGAWHSFRVLCEGLRIQVWLDGRQILDSRTSPRRLDVRAVWVCR
jgi:glycyl-tRNA synthetase alpha subunit